ncbi:MAG: RagB/SusD family nutrient uptake outer membrane protein [Bacteroidota bacterium]
MKKINVLLLFLFIGLAFTACDDYLDRTPDAEVTELDVFGTFEDFQGFIEPMYSLVVDYNQHALTTGMNLGGEIIGFQGWSSGDRARRGDYLAFHGGGNGPAQQSNFYCTEDNEIGNTDSGIWPDGWRGIRIANLALEKLELMTDATQEERDLIEGQAYFFRAWFHWEIGRYYGGMPYVDRFLQPADDLLLPRLNWHEMAERIVSDFDRAAELLPEDWDETTVGGQFRGANAGRATKGAALAFKAKTLLYAGSPLMNGFSTGSFTYDESYMQRAAEAANEVIELADQGVYALVPFEEYQTMFARNDGEYPWTSENIFQKISAAVGNGVQNNRHGRLFNPPRFGGNGIQETLNQLYADRFEMTDGTRYRIEYDNDDSKRWENRDPRFRQNVLVDRDKAGLANGTTMNLHEGGNDKNHSGTLTPYITRKFWAVGANRIDQVWNQFRYVTPHMRLAEVYLIYAEAASEGYGGGGAMAPGASLTAADALNVVRRRAGMPDVSPAASGYNSFRELVQNERWVELCFEGQWFSDIRRWYLAHLPENKPYVDLKFDRDWTTFNREVIAERVFDNPRHYWMPIPRAQTQIYLEFAQNPGW